MPSGIFHNLALAFNIFFQVTSIKSPQFYVITFITHKQFIIAEAVKALIIFRRFIS